jgi:hypothetical protein
MAGLVRLASACERNRGQAIAREARLGWSMRLSARPTSRDRLPSKPVVPSRPSWLPSSSPMNAAAPISTERRTRRGAVSREPAFHWSRSGDRVHLRLATASGRRPRSPSTAGPSLSRPSAAIDSELRTKHAKSVSAVTEAAKAAAGRFGGRSCAERSRSLTIPILCPLDKEQSVVRGKKDSPKS